MDCIICGNKLNNDVCNICGYSNYNKTRFLSKFIKTKTANIEYSEEIIQVNNFFREIHNLSKSEKYISRKESLYNINNGVYEYFIKLIKSNDLDAYCKKYHYHPSNIKLFIKKHREYNEILDSFNQQFVERELINKKEYFDNILKACDPNILLDEEQRIAILTDEDYNLVIAGAGAGKTTTVAGKVKYLVDQLNIDPKHILIVSFTNKAVNELKSRINKQLKIDCPIATFHSIGRAITLKDDSQLKQGIISDSYWIINNFLTNTAINDTELLKKIVMLFGYYLDIPEDIIKDLNLEEYFDLKDNKYYTTIRSDVSEYNQVIIDSRTKEKKTINNEILKSFQEVQIANFLYLNNIDYEYEKPYKYRIPNAKKIYTPDFYIRQGNLECYIEHFGVTENLKNNRYDEETLKKYVDSMEYKVFHHKKFNTNLITTFSSYNDKRELLDHLKEELLNNGFVLQPRDDKTVYQKLISSTSNRYFFKLSFLAQRFIHNFKAKGYDEGDFSLLKSRTNNPRNLLFIDIIERVYLNYQSVLKSKNSVDFEDMINESSKLLNEVEGMGNKLPFKYVIVDEYQDISRQRFNLVKALNEVTNAKIIAVGDDWQSIYAFSGAEVSLFTKFSEEFGYCKELKISKTYRNSQELINVAGNFIQKNSSQIKKSLKSDKNIDNPVVIYTYSDDYYKNKVKGYKGVRLELAEKLEEALGHLIKWHSGNTINILLIGRYGFDGIHLIESDLFHIEQSGKHKYIVCNKYKNYKMTFLTAHSSKGLTFDEVFIINAQNSVYGFPSQIEDDPIIKMVTVNDNSYDFAEERRLFYVAMTRTKNHVFILAPTNNPSRFVIELLKDNKNILVVGKISSDLKQVRKNRKYCPKCGYPLQLKYNSAYGLKLYICTNEPEVCDFMSNDLRSIGNIHLCDKCDGYMIIKKITDKNNFFYGCTNYKKNGSGCNNTENIIVDEN